MIEAGRLLAGYVGLTVAAYLFHLLGGVLSVGPAEVRRQMIEAWEQITPAEYALLILTAGILPRDKPEIEEIEEGER